MIYDAVYRAMMTGFWVAVINMLAAAFFGWWGFLLIIPSVFILKWTNERATNEISNIISESDS